MATKPLEEADRVALNLDSVFMLVPATWEIAGAGPIPTTRNKFFGEGRLEPVQADVAELVSAGGNLPGSLIEATGTNGAGGRIGVVAGVYDTGGDNPMVLAREAVARATPNASVTATNLFGLAGIRTLLHSDEELVAGGSVICDYWAGIRGAPDTTFLLLRFWRSGPAGADEKELFDDMAGSLFYGGGGSFAGPLRPLTLNKYGPPDGEASEPGRFRYAGWRLGQVFSSKMLPAKQNALMTEIGIRPRDGLVFLLVFLTWIVATMALLGVGPVLLVGGLSAGSTLPQLRSRGLKAVVVLAIFLAGLLVLGVTTS